VLNTQISTQNFHFKPLIKCSCTKSTC